jgi:competence protein ComEC
MNGREVSVSGRVLEPVGKGRGGLECQLKVESLNGERLWWGPGVRLQGVAEPLVAGRQVRLRGVLVAVPAARNPGEFDKAAWLHRQGTASMLEIMGPVETGEQTMGGRLAGWLERVRVALGAAMTRGLDPECREAKVIRAMTLGEPPRDDEEVVEMFRYSGTLHVFSVSGMHVGMVGGLLWLLLRACGVPRRGAVGLLIVGMFFYAGITGMAAPALRSALMAGVFLSGFLLRRQPQLLNTLAASLLAVLVWDTHQLFTAGFQLSYGVLASIAVLGGRATHGLAFLARPERYLPRALMTPWQERSLRWRRKIVGLLGMSAAAWTGSSPLCAFHFAMVSPVAIIAGLPVAGLVWVVISVALFGGLLGLVWPPAAVPFNRANACVARLTVQTAGWFADLPGACFRWGAQPQSDVLVFDLPRGAAACHLNFGGGTLLDSGSAGDFRWIVNPALKRLNLTVDSLIVSHPDSAHAGGMVEALGQFAPRQALLPVTSARSSGFRGFQAMFPAAMVPRAAGTRYALGDGALLEVLYLAPAEDRGAVADDRVMVLALERGGWRILFTGNAGALVERRLLESGVNLRADVVVMGRHWSGLSGTDEFLAAVGPQIIVASHADFPRSAAIPAAWASWVSESGITLMRQDQIGAVSINWTASGLSATGFLGGQRVSLATPRSAVGRDPAGH